VRAVRPWRNALRDERCLPDSVRGPVEWRELARLVATRWASFGLAHNGLASGAANSAEVPLSFGAALGGLCAFEELARNEGGGEHIVLLGGAPAPLRASQRSTGSVVDGVA
jgi:hypothetical protein